MKWKVHVTGRQPGAQGLPTISRLYDVEAPTHMEAIFKVHDVVRDDKVNEPMEHVLPTHISYQDINKQWVTEATMDIMGRKDLPRDGMWEGRPGIVYPKKQ